MIMILDILVAIVSHLISLTQDLQELPDSQLRLLLSHLGLLNSEALKVCKV